MPNTLCIIPARGGSKRIPRKNIKNFLGKPIIAYSIEAALSSGLFEEVMVSTEDEEIEEVAKSYGAIVPFKRSKENADDFASTLDVVKEVLKDYYDRGTTFENICVLYPTAPLISQKRFKEGFNVLRNSDAVIPICRFDYPIWRSFHIENGKLCYQWPKYSKTRSQDLPELFHDAGQWFFIKYNWAIKGQLPDNIGYVLLPSTEVQDIDSLEDWTLAEIKYKLLMA